MHILLFSGSLRRQSLNSALLQAFATEAGDTITTEIADYTDIPHYNGDTDKAGAPSTVTALVDQVRRADAVLFAVPEYNYSFPGVLKNAIDWISRADDQPFKGKSVGIVGASMGNLGTARAQYHLRQVFVFLDARVMNRPEVFVGAAHTKFDAGGQLTDTPTKEFLAGFTNAFLAWAKAAN